MTTASRRAFATVCMLLLPPTAPRPAAAQVRPEGGVQRADGLAVYLGVVPAALVRGHPPAHAEREVHGGTPSGRHVYHLVVALFEVASGVRVADAVVTASVHGLGHVGQIQRPLEPMTIAGALNPAVRPEAPRLAAVLLDAYLRQIFVLGVFHADPHPGNLFVMPDGRLCFHDLGLVGELDRAARRDLGLFLLAFARRDADWVLDAAIALGLLGGPLDRAEFRRGIGAILAEFSALPLAEWSMAEAVLRIARLGSGENFVLPHELAVLMRTLFLLEGTLRELDPGFRVFNALLACGERELGPLARAATEAEGARPGCTTSSPSLWRSCPRRWRPGCTGRGEARRCRRCRSGRRARNGWRSGSTARATGSRPQWSR